MNEEESESPRKAKAQVAKRRDVQHFCSDAEYEAGTIECLRLKNFMCHSNFEIEFCPFVNAVIGRNGSGKSSILAGIRVALGGKANPTGKGVALKNTIQQGKQFAEVSIVLRNTGRDAFQKDKYGSQITIERRLTFDGASSYKIKDTSGSVVSTKRDALDAILAAFNIQIDNPIGILTQSMSKSFLNSNDPKAKYQLFIQATQLDTIEKAYKQCSENARLVGMLLENKSKILDSLRSEIEAMDTEKENILINEKLKKKRRENIEEYVWAHVQETETLTEHILKIVHKKSCEVESASKRLRESEIILAKANRDVHEKSMDVKKLHEECNALKREFEAFSRKIKDIEKEMREIKGHMGEWNFHDKQKEVEDLEKKMKHATERLETTALFLRSEIENKILACSGRKKRHEEQVEALRKDLQSDRNAAELKQQEILSLTTRIKNIYDDRNLKSGEIDKLKFCKQNQVMAYGRMMPALLQRISEEIEKGNFIRPPIGPLGQYIKVTDRKWAPAVEICLGVKLLKSFICDNIEDQEHLHKIMQEMLPATTSYQVITSQFIDQVYDVENQRVRSEEFSCVLDVLEVEHPMVLNCLIDNRGIENILLIPYAASAREIMSKNPPAKCTEAYTVSGISIHPYPNYRYYSSRRRTATLISGVAFEASIDALTQELNALKNTSERLEKDRSLTHNRICLLEQNEQAINKEIRRLNELIQTETVTIQELENTEISDDINTEREQELFQAKQDLQYLLQKRTAFVRKLQEKKQQLDDVKYQRTLVQKQYFSKKAEFTKFMRDQIIPNRAKNHAENQRMAFKKQYDSLTKKLGDALKAYREKNFELQEELAAAEKLCPRVETSRHSSVIQHDVDHLSSRITELAKKSPNIELNAQKYRKKTAEYDTTIAEMRGLKAAVKKQQEMMKVRLKGLENIRQCICLRVVYLFTTILYLRNFVGKMQFDHENRSLVIEISAAMSKEKLSTRALSGGEKSFVTVAFLLALWEAVELPFRILDEYDVFMDQRTRQKSTDLMVSTTLDNNKQFIFFSPCSLVMEESDKKKITYLKNPRQTDKRKKL